MSGLVFIGTCAGLSKVLAKVEEDNVRQILINISLRIRPCFEKEKAAVRAAAIKLFGNLSRFGDGPSREPFAEQIHANLVSLLLHLNDEDADVRKACKESLQELGPLLDSEPVNGMIQKLLDPAKTLHYGEFMNDLSKLLIVEFDDKINFYTVRSAAAAFCLGPPVALPPCPKRLVHHSGGPPLRAHPTPRACLPPSSAACTARRTLMRGATCRGLTLALPPAVFLLRR